MYEELCPTCNGRGGGEIDCTKCHGTGWNPTPDNAFGQCHRCFGEGVIDVDTCPTCFGEGTKIHESDLFEMTPMFHEGKLYDMDEASGLILPESYKAEIVTDLNVGIANLILRAENNPELIDNISPREFENFVAELFRQQGFKVEVTQRTRDGGRDIIAIRSELDLNVKYIIECKKYCHTNKVGVELVRQLYGVQQAESANKSVLVTTSSFTQGAIDFANQHNTKWHMDLKSYSDLLSWVKRTYGPKPLF
ncbi:restriction endonuclease [Vibrio aestuarianus]|uniref:restriction endonuclease n=2 Tax=Vibrio TaxID=662 RepID=UPI001593734A|nr:restriction endonuclease [Vibrio aestuarianus]MDE1237172.1 restriction endonuclease [Vibrio aestuarianus]MDE1248049.1 restriction endonuclease [Vibrio aestuarianus]NGZ65396.1 hypothetical protein [Vibrio aestuarianus subsp. cardii]